GGVIPFRAQDFGEKQLTLGLRFRSPDQHYLHAEDSENSNIFGETSIKVGSGSSGEHEIKMIKIDSPKDKELINNPVVIIEGTSEPFVNLYVTGGKERFTGDTDINGDFSLKVELDSTLVDHTIRVQDDSGYLDSGNIQLKLDMQPPEIGEINFLPENPEEDTDVLLVAKILSDDISDIYLELQDETFNLEQVSDQPEKYQTLLKVPSAGINEAIIHAIDNAGNESTKSITLISKLRGLPRVTGVTANTEDNTVTLQWKAITDEVIEAYRIYVGESPEEYIFSLDTNYATTAAQVAGLKPGTQYYFTVTAIQGDRESTEKSEVIKATIQGLRLEVGGGKNSLVLDWSNMSSSTPLSSFILEYGVEPNTFTEKRVLSGEARHTIIRDLLNGVTYFIKISPVSVGGTIIEEMIAKGEGAPVTTAAGFEPTNADSVPFEIGYTQQGNVTPPPNLHQAAPTTTSTGLPNFVIWILIFVSGILFVIWRKRRKNTTEALAFLQAMDSRYRQ
ncbi:MAG: fibronectin type III domain-containing protein, partial [Candidatus Peribacteraceae bacterium]|nr:fibronectin type III domain-containing protein [Candidatus Peribacteraceae bacterium]